MGQPPTAVMAVAPAPCVLYSGRPMSEDRRENERVEMLGSMPGATTVIQPLGIKELSRRGAQVETRFALPVDSLREFRLNLSGRSMVVKGRVAHCHVSEVDAEGVIYRAGVEFVDLPERALSAISDFLDEIKAGRKS